jgi:hypothetical protein
MGWSEPKPKASKNDDGTVDFYIWWEEDLDLIVLYEQQLVSMLKILREFKHNYKMNEKSEE